MSVENKISYDRIRKSLIASADELEKNRQYYNDLDSPLGDSDHGDSICSSFKEVRYTILNENTSSSDISELLKSIGKAIIA